MIIGIIILLLIIITIIVVVVVVLLLLIIIIVTVILIIMLIVIVTIIMIVIILLSILIPLAAARVGGRSARAGLSTARGPQRRSARRAGTWEKGLSGLTKTSRNFCSPQNTQLRFMMLSSGMFPEVVALT